jgi:hypothetical protein
MTPKTSMFSVSVTTDGVLEPTWCVTCDRCGQELDVEDSPLLVFRIRGLDELVARDPGRAQMLYDSVAAESRQPSRMVMVDHTTEVFERHTGLGDRIKAHAAKCERC